MPIPARDFDPTEVAVSWKTLTARGHDVVFATPDGCPGAADDIMLTGRGLPLVGGLLRANADARAAYSAMLADPPSDRR
jgi:putative intracellular protease/amidase